MKNLLQSIAAVALSASIFSHSMAALPIDPKIECKNNTCETFRIGMYRVKNTETMNLLVEKDKGQRLEIKLTDFKGKVLHDEMIPRAARKFGQKLNFAALQDGTYTLEISTDNEKIVKSIFLSTDEVREVSRLLMTAN